MNTHIQPEIRLAVLEAYKADVPIAEIVDRLNVSRSTVDRIRRSEETGPHTIRNAVTKREAMKFASLLSRGMNQCQAAERLGRSRVSLRTACRRYEIEIPRSRTKAGELKQSPNHDWFSLPPWERMQSFVNATGM